MITTLLESPNVSRSVFYYNYYHTHPTFKSKVNYVFEVAAGTAIAAHRINLTKSKRLCRTKD